MSREIIYEHSDTDGDAVSLLPLPSLQGKYALDIQEADTFHRSSAVVAIKELEEMLEAARKYERENRHRIALEEIRAATNGTVSSTVLTAVHALAVRALEEPGE